AAPAGPPVSKPAAHASTSRRCRRAALDHNQLSTETKPAGALVANLLDQEQRRSETWREIGHEHRADSPPHRDLRPHAIRPEPVDRALLQRLRRGDAEVDAGAVRARYRRDRDVIAHQVEAGCDEEAAQALLDPGRRPDSAALDDVE